MVQQQLGGRVGSRNVSTAGVEAPLVCKWHGKLL